MEMLLLILKGCSTIPWSWRRHVVEWILLTLVIGYRFWGLHDVAFGEGHRRYIHAFWTIPLFPVVPFHLKMGWEIVVKIILNPHLRWRVVHLCLEMWFNLSWGWELSLGLLILIRCPKRNLIRMHFLMLRSREVTMLLL